VRPSEQADAIGRYPWLLQQPFTRSQDVGDPLAAGQHAALLDPALRTEFARTVTVGQQYGIAGFQQLLGPFAIARLNLIGMPAQSAAAMQRDHGGKRTGAVGLEQLRVQHATA
jgi:hypothetical protein